MAGKGEQIPKAWIGRRVKVKLRTESGGGYWVFGRLRSVTDEGIKFSPQFLPNASEGRSSSKRPRSYPWMSISDVRPLERVAEEGKEATECSGQFLG